MKAYELIRQLEDGAFTPEITCDTVKAGSTEKELYKVAVSMFATVDTARAAKDWGADMLIVHEPTYYDHMERFVETPVTLAKRRLIEESGIVVYRYHDNMHYRKTDLITKGMLHYLGLSGRLEITPHFASYVFVSDEAVSALELARRMEKELGIKHVRIAGNRDAKVKRIGACFGTPGGVFELLTGDEVDMILTGEACEWKLCEYARDAAALGMNKSMIVMGHIGSERDGMRLLAEDMKKKYTDLEIKYFECGEVYTYTDEKDENGL